MCALRAHINKSSFGKVLLGIEKVVKTFSISDKLFPKLVYYCVSLRHTLVKPLKKIGWKRPFGWVGGGGTDKKQKKKGSSSEFKDDSPQGKPRPFQQSMRAERRHLGKRKGKKEWTIGCQVKKVILERHGNFRQGSKS